MILIVASGINSYTYTRQETSDKPRATKYAPLLCDLHFLSVPNRPTSWPVAAVISFRDARIKES
jgi:hypothetical protein